jgi:lipopolysaccharide biosynthesis glycosyltransferase
MNIAFRDQWQRLPIWYNIEEALVGILPVQEILDNAFIIHFSGASKPWKGLNPSPFTRYWDDVYEKTFGRPFNRDSFKPPRHIRFKATIRSHLSAFIGRIGL